MICNKIKINNCITQVFFQVDSRPSSRSKPTPPKKPERLSLQRTTSLLSVDQVISSSRCLERIDKPFQDEQLTNAHMWKSTGNGLNRDHFDAISTFTSPAISSGTCTTLKLRAEFVPRRESSPLPKCISSKKSKILFDSSNCGFNIPNDNKIHGTQMNLTMMKESIPKDRVKDSFDKSHNSRQPLLGSWSPDERQDSSSPYLTTSSSSYHTPSSGGSPCGSSTGRIITGHESNHLEGNTTSESPDQSTPSCSPDNVNNYSNSSITPTNTPKTSPAKLSDVSSVSNAQSHMGCVNECNLSLADITLVHAEPMYGYLPLKQTNQSNVNSRKHHQNISLSSMHNIQKNYNNLTRGFNTTKFDSLGAQPEGRVAPNHSNCRLNLGSVAAKENSPVNSYSYCDGGDEKYEAFSSLKRYIGKNNGSGNNLRNGTTVRNSNSAGSTAPSTPITPRSNSALKICNSQFGEEDWC